MSENLLAEIREKEQQIHNLRTDLARLRLQVKRKPIDKEYSFKNLKGQTVSLADLFGSSNELFVVQNMGEWCPYCTLWADGFNGVLHHIQNRCAFAVISDDPSSVQRDFAESRGWRFQMASSSGTTFKEDFGFRDGNLQTPGASTFYKDPSGQVFHCNDTFFGPGDPFCGIWFMIDMLPEGENNWRPKLSY